MAALISYVWKTDNPLKAINDMHKKIMRCNDLQTVPFRSTNNEKAEKTPAW